MCALCDQYDPHGIKNLAALLHREMLEDGSDALDAGSDVFAREIGSSGAQLYSAQMDTTVYGGAGSQTLTTTAGVDSLYGGDGDDIFLFENGDDVTTGDILDGGADTDKIVLTGAGDYNFTADFMSSDIEEIEFTAEGTNISKTLRLGSNALDGPAELGSVLIDGNENTGSDDHIIVSVTTIANVDLSGWTFQDWQDNDAITINGSGSANVLTGTSQDDAIYSGGGSDTVYGGDGDDTVYENDLNGNEFYGGVGDDSFVGRLVYFSTIDGGAGIDTIDLSSNTAAISTENRYFLDIDRGFSQNGGISYNPTSWSNIENLIGFSSISTTMIGNSADNMLTGLIFNDTFYAELGNDTAFGGDGNDTLFGEGGMDSLYGEAGLDELRGGGGADFLNGGGGNDYLNGGGGNDLMVGGGGNDTLIGNSGIDTMRGSVGADSLDGGDGIDILSYSSDAVGVNVNLATNIVSGGEATGDTIINFEQVIGGGGNDTLIGDDNDNALIGGGGTDNIIGGLGDDRLVGGDGDDKIRGDEGADKMRGGKGSDTLVYSTDTTGVQIDLQTNVATGGDATGDDIGAFENVFGGGGNDTLSGASGDNTLKGNGGNDILTGRDGNDVLIGGGGDDTLSGGADTDTLTGNTGADTFEFLAGGDDDTITDFEVGIDTLKIYGLTSADVSFFDAGGGDTLVTLSTGDTILVANTTIAELDTFSDFDFV